MSDIDVRDAAPLEQAEQPEPWWRSARLPYGLLGLLFAIFTWFTFTQGRVHGRTYDEYLQDDYGAAVLRWYLSGGSDRGFLEMPDYLHMPEHGSGFELMIAFVQHFTSEQWGTRTLVNGVAGLIGLVIMALAGKEMAGPWGAFAAATGLALYPRYAGAMHNNSKDVPLAVAMLLVLWLVLRMMRRWTAENRRFEVIELMGLGAALGLAGSIRVNALSWVVLLAFLVIGFWIKHGRTLRGAELRAEISRQVGAVLVIGTNCYLVMSLLWPYLLVYPIEGLRRSVEVMAAYDWDNPILFGGEMVRSTELPWYYAPWWLVIGSPLPVVLLTVASFGALIYAIARHRPVDSRLLLIGGYILLPLLLIIGAHSTLYNSLRQFLFIAPGMILLAAVLLVRWASAAFKNGRTALAWTLVGAVILGQVEVAVAVARIYPYEYSYFSPVVGGYTTARHNYESTYYGTCTRAGAIWLGEHYRDYAPGEPTFRDEVSWNSLTEADLPDNFVSIGQGEPMFRLTNGDPGGGYKIVHTVMLEGEPLCHVSVQEQLAPVS